MTEFEKGWFAGVEAAARCIDHISSLDMVAAEIRALLPPATTPPRIAWQCSGCHWGFTGKWQKTCPSCGRDDYWCGSVSPDAKLWRAPPSSAEEGAATILRCAVCHCGWEEGTYDPDCECRCHTDPAYKPTERVPHPPRSPTEPAAPRRFSISLKDPPREPHATAVEGCPHGCVGTCSLCARSPSTGDAGGDK